jgi:tRNA threonylcarbamoyladenosine biosynthesis protein TsaB
MIYILHIETSTKVCSVALSLNGMLLALEEMEEEGYSHGENLTLLIEAALKKSQISINQLRAVSVASGPGSYTGLRIGVSTAKGLCYPLSLPLIAIDSLTSLTEIARIKHPSINLCPVIDARRMEVYNAVFDGSGHRIKDISADIIDPNSYAAFEPFIFFGDGAEKLEELWKNKNCVIDTSIKSSAAGQIAQAYRKFQSEEFENIAYFEPFYLKDFVGASKKI